jgi:hypothetical protein
MILSYSSDIGQVPFHGFFLMLMFSYSTDFYDFFTLSSKNWFGCRIYPKQRTDFGIKLQILDLHSIILNDKIYIWKLKIKKLKKRMWSGTCLTSKLYDKIIKRPSKTHETIPLNVLLSINYSGTISGLKSNIITEDCQNII